VESALSERALKDGCAPLGAIMFDAATRASARLARKERAKDGTAKGTLWEFDDWHIDKLS
jgi:hypothetical protein